GGEARLRPLVHVGRTAGVAADDRRSSGDLGDVAGEIPRFVDGDPFRGVPGLVHDLDVAGDDDVEAAVAVAGPEEGLAVAERLPHRVGAPAEGDDRVRVESGEGGRMLVVLGHAWDSARGRAQSRKYGSAAAGMGTSCSSA